MIAPDAKPIDHVSPYKRIDILHPGRRKWITRQDIENEVCREPDLATYNFDGYGLWTLKDDVK